MAHNLDLLHSTFLGRAIRRAAPPTGITLQAIGLLMLVGCCREKPVPEPAKHLPRVKVRVQTVAARQYQGSEEVVGTVRAKVRAKVAAKVSGRIASMDVRLGQQVKKGQVLARIDVREIRAKLDQAQALQAQARADLKRFSQLLQANAVTRQEFDAAQARARVAQASVREAQSLLSYSTVTAPFAGVVTRKAADAGDLATPGRLLLEVEDPAALRLVVDVPEALISKIKPGGQLPLRLASLTEPIEGTVSGIAPSADPNSRTFVVEIDLPANDAIRVGQFGRAIIPTGATEILRVKASAVVLRGQLEIVFVVTNSHASLRLVKTGKRIGDDVEVVSGLMGGETIVIDNASKLSDGQPLEVVK